MKVIAIKKGYYGNVIREPGAEFALVAYKNKAGKEIGSEQQFSDSWMKKVDAPKAASKEKEAK